MENVSREELDEVIAKTFDGVRTAVNSHSEKSLNMYSNALHSLVLLRQQILDEERSGS